MEQIFDGYLTVKILCYTPSLITAGKFWFTVIVKPAYNCFGCESGCDSYTIKSVDINVEKLPGMKKSHFVSAGSSWLFVVQKS